MDTLTKEDLTALSAQKGGHAVSLYAPMHQAGPDTRENPIRFKNRVQEAAAMLEEKGLGPREVTALLAPAQALIDDDDLWQHQYGGFAMFLSEGESHPYSLPVEFESLTVVSERYHLKPLLPMLTGDGRFHVLAVSLNKARLFAATQYSVTEVKLADDVPTSMAEALRFDDPEESLQYHAVSGSRPGGARPDIAFHGSGASDDDKKEDILRYFKMLENGVTDELDGGTTPLVFAGVDYLFSLYQEANHYNHLMPEAVTGNPDEWRGDEVREKAWAVVAPHFDQARQEALEKYASQAHLDTASGDLHEVVLAAVDARVDTLIVGLGEQQWGSFDPDSRTLELHDEQQSGDEDLLDLAAVQTLLNGGKVYAVPKEEVPDGGLVAAVYRY